MLSLIEKGRGSVNKPTGAIHSKTGPRAGAMLAVLLAAPPTQAAAGQGTSIWPWALFLLALLGAGAAWASGLRERRGRERLQRQLDEYVTSMRQQGEQLQAARREREGLVERLQQQAVEFGRQAHEDGLTGLPNGRAFDEGFSHHFARAKRHGQPLCLMLLDLDHIRQINDTWSHAVGDGVLGEAAGLLRSVCRTSDLPARLGGDAFAVILTDTDMEGGKRFSQRLHAAFASCRNWHSAEAGPNYVSFSAGLVQLGEDDQAPAQLRQRADRALYLAKHAGGARTSLG